MKLEGYIAELLHGNNCVIVPEFGGFVANYRSAVIDKYTKKIHPPSKSVLFNPKLTNNDGLLGNYVAQNQDITYPEALTFIANQVIEWKKEFEEGRRIEVGEVGFLYKEKTGNIHFEQSREVNLLLQAYGLRSIDFVVFDETQKSSVAKVKVGDTPKETRIDSRPKDQKPNKYVTLIDEPLAKKVSQPEIASEEKNKIEAKQQAAAEKKVVVKKEAEEKTSIALNLKEEIRPIADEQVDEGVIPIRRNLGVTILKYAAAVAFVPILFYSYWIPMETDALETSSIQLTDFNPVISQKEKFYHHRDEIFRVEETEKVMSWDEITENINASVYNFELTEDFYIPILLTDRTEAITTLDDNTFTENVEVHEDVEVQLNNSGPYHVIAGCFSVRSNAENQVKELQSQGFSASILDKSGGLHRVSAGNYADKDQAKKGLEKVKGSGQSGWILKK